MKADFTKLVQAVRNTIDFLFNVQFNYGDKKSAKVSISEIAIKLWYVAYLAFGVLVFMYAKQLSQNVKLQYGTRISIGIVAPLLILMIILHRVFPQSLKKLGYLMVLSSCYASMYFWQLFTTSFSTTVFSYWKWILGYIAAMGFVSLGVCYKYGPITDQKNLNILQWLIQAFGLILIYQGTKLPQLSVAFIIVILTIYNLPSGIYNNGFTRYLSKLVQADIFEVHDSEDEELNRALEASLTDNPTPKVHTEPTQITDLLKCFQSKVNNEVRQEIIVSRKSVLFSAFKALKRPRFCFSCKIYAKFSGEMGVDHGGPRREFFRLALMELVNSSLFEGKETSKMFSHNLEKLESEEYRLAGRLVALSLAQEGPGLYVMNPLLYDMMLGQHVNFMDFDLECLPDPDTKRILQQLKDADTDQKRDFDLECLPDPDTKRILQQLKDADTDQKRDIFLSAHGDWIIEQGYSGVWRMKKEDRCYVLNCLLKQLVMNRTSAEIKQFCNGLDDVMGMWTTIQQNPRQWKALFCDDLKTQKLTKSCFEALYKINWSEPGSNKRSEEEDTIYSWEVFLQDVNDEEVDCTFKDILIFVTGADHVPPGGFPSQISIDFYSENGKLPFSSTCTLSISLPRGIQNPEFTRLLLRSLKECVGFGKI